jgi:hydrophobic/amphiphilic exporter-1 (mainly G- bacteria), HAE1 family
MVFLGLIVVGVVSLRSLAVDLLPEVEFTQLSVRTRYPNVGPREIEQIITDPIENAVAGLPDLERVTSRSQEGMSWVRLDFGRGTNVDEAANDLRAALDRLRGELPVEAEPPEILKLDLDRVEVVSLAVTSTRGLEELTRILERDIARRLDQIPGVGSLEVRGGIYRRIRVDVRRDRLKAAGLTVLDLQDALVRENVAAPGGSVQAGLTDIYVRPEGEFESVGQIAATVVRTVGGRPIRVGDVAEVKDDYEDPLFLVEVNGVPAVMLGVQKQSGSNTVAVSDRVREEAERINAERDDLHLTVITDQSQFIRGSIDSVRTSALWGSFLAITILYLFLRNRASTAIIALSIPISVISAFGLLYFGGMSLNQMTFGGLALGVGMIVDNAIVVLDSVVRKREEQGLAPAEAARAGAQEVAGAIVASTLTTCVVFLPVVFTRTTSGALFQALALVVVFALACSLLVALTLVPMLAGRFMRSAAAPAGTRGEGRFTRFEGWYQARLRRALARRRSVFAATALAVGLAMLAFPLIPVELAPQTDADEIDLDVEMAQGTSIGVVRSYVEELETLVRAALPPGQVDFIALEVRGGDADVELALAPPERRSMDGLELADRLREAVDGRVPGAEIRVRAQPGLWILRRVFSSGGGEDALEVELRGFDLDRADLLAAEIRRRMETIPGITDTRLSRREGRPEESLVFDRGRIAELGLSVRDVARTVQASVGGVEAGRFRESGEEFPIVVRLRPEDRLGGEDLQAVSLRTPAGAVVPLSTVVSRSRGRGPVNIERVDGQRVTYVAASLEGGLVLGDAVEQVQEALADLSLPEGYAVTFGGEYEEQQEAARDFTVAILMALVLVYMLMAGQFERFVDPLIVMLSVPVALVGVVPTLLLTGTTLNIQSIMGLVMLVGIVVNNAIVLVDAINMLRRERRMGAAEAVLEAGRLRLRPILMTTTTTVLGLLPLALGFGPGADIQAPLARVVIGGLTVSTLVTLVLVPAAYVSVSGLQARFRASRWRRGEPAEATTA